MKKKILQHFILILCLGLVTLTGCSTDNQSSNKQAENITYANLTDKATQEEIVSILNIYGIPKAQTDTLIDWADDFNQRVASPKLPEGFVSMEGNYVDYTSVILNPKAEQNDTLSYDPEANCRLTAFMLLKNFIQTNQTKDETDTYLVFDVERIDQTEQFKLKEKERNNYYALYNWIPVTQKDSLAQHIEKIQQAWKDRNITLDTPDGVSMITVYLHSSFDQVRFPGHVGVLVETDDGLLFVEKYGDVQPFQVTKFQNRDQLKKYLLARPDLYGDETELEPILMENGQVM